MALNVCIGPPFTVGGTGELEINGAKSLAWPFGAAIGSNNGLNVDPSGGLWTAPHGVYSLTDNQSGVVSVPVASGGTWSMPANNRAIVNPSPTSQMQIFGTSIFNLNVTPGTTAALVISMWGAAEDSTVTPTLFYSNETTTGTTLSTTNFVSYPFNFIIPAAGTKQISYNSGITLSLNSGTVTGWSLRTKGVGILIDPSQAGGVTPL